MVVERGGGVDAMRMKQVQVRQVRDYVAVARTTLGWLTTAATGVRFHLRSGCGILPLWVKCAQVPTVSTLGAYCYSRAREGSTDAGTRSE